MYQISSNSRLKKALLFVFLTLFLFLPRIPNIDRFLWKDEVISLQTLEADISKNPLFFGITTNLPLFFYVLRIPQFVLQSINPFLPSLSIENWIFRLVPLLFSILTGLYIFYFIRKEVDKKNNFFLWAFFLLFAFSPLQIYYSQELRPYSLLQFLIVLNISYIYTFLRYSEKKVLQKFFLVNLLIVITHYSGYFFLAAEFIVFFSIFLYKLYARKPVIEKGILFSLIIPLVIGFTLTILMLKNPLFSRSVDNLELGTNTISETKLFSELKLFTERFKEVISFYYWYGIYYFSVDNFVQFIFKKLILILLGIGALFLFTKKQLESKFALISIFVLITSLTLAYIAEKFGYFPFGGRHIMPYSVILFGLVAFMLHKLNRFHNVGYLIFGLIFLPILFYDYCTLIKLLGEISIESLQGNIFRTCFGF